MVTKKKKMKTDGQLLRHVLQTWLEIKDADYANHDITNALTHAGVIGFYKHFVLLTEPDIDTLIIPASTRSRMPQHLSVINKRLLKLVLSLYHTISRENGKSYDVSKVRKVTFDEYRVTDYDPSAPIVPWFVKKRNAEDPDIANWKKAIRPSRGDFKELKDDTHWNLHSEHVKTTLQSQGLLHLIDEKFVPKNTDLDKLQQNWLYKILQDTLKTPSTRSIIKAHLGDMNTRKIWKELCNLYSGSMNTEFRTQQLSTYLTSTRLKDGTWKGSQENFILHFKEQVRVHNELCEKEERRFTGEHAINMLNAAVNGIPHLQGVLFNWRATAKASNSGKDLTFEEYIGLLQQQAQTHDVGNRHRTNPRARRSVNQQEIEHVYEDYSVNNHETVEYDLDTPVEQLVVMQNETQNSNYANGPIKVMMDRKTWNSLNDNTKKHWDCIEQTEKEKILNYIIT